jgi:hypothetical protein
MIILLRGEKITTRKKFSPAHGNIKIGHDFNNAACIVTELSSLVVRIHASCSESFGLKSRSTYRLSCRYEVVFRPSRQFRDSRLFKLGHKRFLPHPFQFTVH